MANIIKVEEEQGKEEKIRVHYKPSPQKEASSTWGWYEEFAEAWSETFVTKKRKRNPKG